MKRQPQRQKPEVDEHGLGHHGRPAEKFHIGVENQLYNPKQYPLDRIIPLSAGYGLHNTNGKTDDTAHQCADQGNPHADAGALQH